MPRLLCLFSSSGLAAGSFLGRQAGHWRTEVDQGQVELVPLVVDADAPSLAVSGLFAAAVVVCAPEDLGAPLAAALSGAAGSFAAARLPCQLVPAAAPVSVLAWLAREAPALLPAWCADAEVRLASPTWWRDRARRLLAQGAAAVAPPGAAEAAEAEDLGDELAAFVARRGW